MVITAKLDRMFRSGLDALEVLAKLKRQEVSLHMIDLGGDVTSNGISKLVSRFVLRATPEKSGEMLLKLGHDELGALDRLLSEERERINRGTRSSGCWR